MVWVIDVDFFCLLMVGGDLVMLVGWVYCCGCDYCWFWV